MTAIGKFLILLALCLASEATAAPRDCPLVDRPFSLDSPLLDVMLNPVALGALRNELGPFMDRSPFLTGTTVPAFSAIISPRILAGYAKAPDAMVARIDAALAAIPVSRADRIKRCARYDDDRPHIVLPKGKPRVLVFEKMTGFRDTPSVDAAHAALDAMAKRNGWSIAFTDKGGVMTPAWLRQFDAVIWNNVSGDVLTLSQRAAFRHYIERGGGFVGIHGSAGDPVTFWDWYVDTLIGARFLGHPMKPQFQTARVVIPDATDPVVAGLPGNWTMTEEWYSFRASPSKTGAIVLATLDEDSYSPGPALAMGQDHPIAWKRCVGKGRSFYSAIGHIPTNYAQPQSARLLEQGIIWALGKNRCSR